MDGISCDIGCSGIIAPGGSSGPALFWENTVASTPTLIPFSWCHHVSDLYQTQRQVQSPEGLRNPGAELLVGWQWWKQLSVLKLWVHHWRYWRVPQMDFLNWKCARYLLTNVSLRKGWKNLGKSVKYDSWMSRRHSYQPSLAFTLTKATIVLTSLFTLHEETKGRQTAESKLTCHAAWSFYSFKFGCYLAAWPASTSPSVPNNSKDRVVLCCTSSPGCPNQKALAKRNRSTATQTCFTLQTF